MASMNEAISIVSEKIDTITKRKKRVISASLFLLSILLSFSLLPLTSAVPIVIADGITNHNAIGAGLGWGNSGDNIWGGTDKVVVSDPLYTVTAIDAYVAYITTAPTDGTWYGGIWSDNAGTPDSLLYYTPSYDCASTITVEWGSGADEVYLNFTDPVELSAGTYHFGFKMNVSNTNTRFVFTGSTDGGAALTITTGWIYQGTSWVNWGISAQDLIGYETTPDPTATPTPSPSPSPSPTPVPTIPADIATNSGVLMTGMLLFILIIMILIPIFLLTRRRH